MKVSISSRHVTLSDEDRGYAEEKFSRLDRFFQGVLNAEVVIKMEDRKVHCEAIIHTKNKHSVVIDVARDEVCEAVDVALDKCERQLRRMKEKLTDRRRKSTVVRRSGVLAEEASGEIEDEG